MALWREQLFRRHVAQRRTPMTTFHLPVNPSDRTGQPVEI